MVLPRMVLPRIVLSRIVLPRIKALFLFLFLRSNIAGQYPISSDCRLEKGPLRKGLWVLRWGLI